MGMYTAHPATESTHEQGGSQGRRRGTPVTEIQGKVAEPSTVPQLVGEGCDFRDLLAAANGATGIENIFGVRGLLVLHTYLQWKLPLTDTV